MLPISLEVTSQPLLFCPQQYLDFGVVSAHDPPKTLKLFVINSGNRPITVQVSIPSSWILSPSPSKLNALIFFFDWQSVAATPANEGLSIDFSPVKVPPSLTTPTLVALVTFRRESEHVLEFSYTFQTQLFVLR